MAIEIVDFPINSMVIFHSYVSLPGRVPRQFIPPWSNERRPPRGSEVFCGLNQPHQWPLGPLGDSGGDNRLVYFESHMAGEIHI